MTLECFIDVSFVLFSPVAIPVGKFLDLLFGKKTFADSAGHGHGGHLEGSSSPGRANSGSSSLEALDVSGSGSATGRGGGHGRAGAGATLEHVTSREGLVQSRSSTTATSNFTSNGPSSATDLCRHQLKAAVLDNRVAPMENFEKNGMLS